MKIKKDWWLANSVLYILDGLFIILSKANAGALQAGLFIGGIQLLVGVALLQRSKIVFWIVLLLSTVSFLSSLGLLAGNSVNYMVLGINVASFVFAIMLWQQIRKEEKKK